MFESHRFLFYISLFKYLFFFLKCNLLNLFPGPTFALLDIMSTWFLKVFIFFFFILFHFHDFFL